MEIIYIAGEILWLAIVVALVVGISRLGKRVDDIKAVVVWSERRIADLENKSVVAAVKKPAARKPAVKKEAK